MTVFEALTRRDSYPCYVNGFRTTCRGGWYYWGRWVLAGLALVFFFLVLLSCCLTARRRRRRGRQPIYGTGWMAPPPKYGDHSNNQAYPMNNYSQQQPDGGYGGYGSPPAYGQQSQYGQQPQYTGTTFNPNDGYYGAQNTGVSAPPNAYQPDHVYPPPPNPPGTVK